MPASYTSGQTSNPRRHPTGWASSQWSHYVSRTPCHGAWTPALRSTHPSIGCCFTAPQIETPICTHCIRTHQFFWQQEHTCGVVGGSSMERGVGGQPHMTPHFKSRHRYTHTHTPEWPSQEEPGSGSTASAPMSDVSAPARTNGDWPPLRPVSVAQVNKPSTMSSSTVHSINLPTDYTVWWFWTMRQSNDCLTSDPICRRASSV